ncbi:SIR2 family NAD-dependent protein deacylase [Actomonas aquatica]|uniref:NAD-dependent protein deacylase n=1 Tax=Actomonas aquatica TaxID=2866162 RepID=A0ABZ1CHK2_9BACT|nr:NAD-dependent deacylase [Opitutus sp. WL0086]WRQ89745.1 NAD-dependent deacylase [Opitutus sp. WL0086]
MKIVVLTGAGISAPSGVRTFRDAGGLWENHRMEDIATPEAWHRDPDLVLRFYNDRRAQLAQVEPNAAHRTLAAWDRDHDVTVITQNVDNLHERAGSHHIVHLHGELTKARSTRYPADVIDIGYAPIARGDVCSRGAQLRPYIVWFGEAVPALEEAAAIMETAELVVVIGTSLQVYPAASLTQFAPPAAACYLVDPRPQNVPLGYEVVTESAERGVPHLADLLGLPQSE